MSYDPNDFTVEWRDIGGGCFLAVVLFLGSLAVGNSGASLKDDVAPQTYGAQDIGPRFPPWLDCPGNQVSAVRQQMPAALVVS